MSRVLSFVLILFELILITVKAKQGYGPGEQDWGYVDVREGAHMFYWLYYTTATPKYVERPLAIWLQGGPGASSTGYGNFEELGPIDAFGNNRYHTWVKDMNVLFIDSPVGTGFSYVDNSKYHTTNNTQIAWDLVSFMKGFYSNHSEFEQVPLHIFSESYGGKMAPEFALELYYAVQRGELKSNLKSVALGDPGTSPIDSVLTLTPYLWNVGVVDENGYDNIMAAAIETEELVKAEEWDEAWKHFDNTINVVTKESHGVNRYNIEETSKTEALGNNLEDLMTGPVSKNLSIPSNVNWTFTNFETYRALIGDFMKPAIHIVEELLEKTDLEVAVYSGQFDLICSTAGTVNWINKMKWSHRNEYDEAPRSGINVNGILEGYEKSGGKFTMFWINRAGHMVPADNPEAMGHILRKLTKYG